MKLKIGRVCELIINCVLMASVSFVFLVVLFVCHCDAMDNGLALTPPMGWNTYNFFKRNYNETVIVQTAEALVTTGMRDVGYVYVNIDGGWWEGVGTGTAVRNASGYLEYDKTKFPSGMILLSSYIHSLNLKFGMYTDAGTRFCDRDTNASEVKNASRRCRTIYTESDIRVMRRKMPSCLHHGELTT
eukprot:m.55772 g.55772  ORF g.55772 m.55772 type:complete len:187 (+) comp34502_c0_seq19:822-1382(+)